MKILIYSFETHLRLDGPVTNHDFILRCQPKTSAVQTVLESRTLVEPECPLIEQTDGFGNILKIGRIAEAHKEFSFISSGMTVVDMDNPNLIAAHDEGVHPMFYRDSMQATANAAMRELAREVTSATSLRDADDFTRAEALSHVVYEHMAYEPDTTSIATTAAEAFDQKRGVCQDYAHILIALCRSQGIPARYVNGLVKDEGATHAWVEVFDGQLWRGIDPTNDSRITENCIVFSHGRDFNDCPIERGVFRGEAEQKQEVVIRVLDYGGIRDHAPEVWV